MQSNEILSQLSKHLDATKVHLQEDLAKLRTGRASASVLDKLIVKVYGTTMSIKQLANITAPEAQLIQVTPFDSSNLQAIASAIRDDQSLGLNPVDDGVVIRLAVPPLTTERRREIVKQIAEIVEHALIAMRNFRHEALKEAEAAQKSRQITEDDFHSIQKQIDELMTQYKNKTEALSEAKEKDVMTV